MVVVGRRKRRGGEEEEKEEELRDNCLVACGEMKGRGGLLSGWSEARALLEPQRQTSASIMTSKRRPETRTDRSLPAAELKSGRGGSTGIMPRVGSHKRTSDEAMMVVWSEPVRQACVVVDHGV